MADKSKYTITLDDDPLIHKIISKITRLRSLPFTCPYKLLKKAPSYHPIGFFCDIHLSEDINALEILPQIRDIWKYVPIIVITTDPEKHLIGKSLAIGANDFICKPLHSVEVKGRLQARINEMISRQFIDEIRFGDVIFNRIHKSIQCDHKTTYIGELEAILFRSLTESGGTDVGKDVLMSKMWGKLVVSKNALDKKISSLRGSLKEVGSNLKICVHYGKGVSILTKNMEIEKTS